MVLVLEKLIKFGGKKEKTFKQIFTINGVSAIQGEMQSALGTHIGQIMFWELRKNLGTR